MPQKSTRSTTLFCFSPAVSLATFLIELGLALYVWARYRLTAFGRISALFLLILGFFQFAEFAICRFDANQIWWARAGLGAIAFLPPLGMHLVSFATSRKMIMPLHYSVASVFAVIFLMLPNAVTATGCTARFTIIDTAPLLRISYSVYYWEYVLMAVGLLAKGLLDRKGNKQATYWLLVALLAAIIPTLMFYFLLPYTRVGHASVFCGFALITGIILTGWVLPRSVNE